MPEQCPTCAPRLRGSDAARRQPCRSLLLGRASGRYAEPHKACSARPSTASRRAVAIGRSRGPPSGHASLARIDAQNVALRFVPQRTFLECAFTDAVEPAGLPTNTRSWSGWLRGVHLGDRFAEFRSRHVSKHRVLAFQPTKQLRISGCRDTAGLFGEVDEVRLAQRCDRPPRCRLLGLG